MRRATDDGRRADARTGRCLSLGIAALLVCGGQLRAQPPGPPADPPPTPREAAQVDITGYWVALVTEDWLWRSITPPRGDTTSVPLNPHGEEVAGQWDLAADEANGEQCRPFGAAGLMRMPLRIHVTWADDETLRVETDAGQQTRLFHFGDAPQMNERSWQGNSVANWTGPAGEFDLRTVFGLGEGNDAEGPPDGSLHVVTTNLRAGYLRKNGIPYSEDARLEEYFDRISIHDNDYLVVLSIVDDPTYLRAPFVTSSQFKREPDDSNWNPTPCRTDPPRAPSGE